MFALVDLLIDVATEEMMGLTCCRNGLLLEIRYRARVDVIFRVGSGIQHSLPFGRLWTGGLQDGRRSTL